MISINQLLNTPKIIYLFICLIYAWIPFEAGSFDVSLKIHVVFLILLIVYALYISSFKLSKYGVSFFIFFIFISSCLFFVSYGYALYNFVPTIAFVSIVGPAIYFNSKFRHQFTQALFLLIVVSVCMIFLQFFVFVITNNILLLHELVFPFSHARIGTEVQYNDLTRMGGMYIEPGTYSNYMFIFLTIYLLLKKKINYLLVFFVAISMIISYSLWGMIFACYLLLLIFFMNFFRASWKIKIISLVLLLFASFYGVQSVKNTNAFQFGMEKLQRNGSEDSTGTKKKSYEKFLNNFDEFFLIGEGFAPKFKTGISSLQDSGLLLNLAIVFGVIPTVILLILYIFFFLKVANYMIFLISLPIFMSKVFYWDPALWLLFFIIFYEYMMRTKNKK